MRDAAMMRLIVVSLFVAFLSIAGMWTTAVQASPEVKQWERMCGACHDGETAPDAASLREKYNNINEFTEAVRRRGGRCMNILKKDETLMEKIAVEIGLEEAK
jgi:hypothetical protein